MTDKESREARTVQPKQGIWRTYDGTDGLPIGGRCLLQDRRGYLWLGTMKGLCRYEVIISSPSRM
jgi:ligand-binding sensor domain-containing protein